MALKTRDQLINSYLQFFKSKFHKQIPSASLIPVNDPTVLFTTAGMHPLVPYLLGQKHPLGKRLVSVQKCIRTGDIEEIGDATHHTFFEMLGNWSLGDYWKPEMIKMSYEFLTKNLKIPQEKLAVTCFAGDKDSPKDLESSKIWLSLGISKERIAFLPKKDNWWGPAGKTGPCGPDTEMFIWSSHDPAPKKFDPNDKNWVEIWNDVFMQYEKISQTEYLPLKQKNVDTGMGVERTLATLNHLDDNYLSPVFLPIIKEIEKISDKKYKDHKENMRIIADHIKASVFIISDGILPGNVQQGYVLRRLIRRAIRHGKRIGLKDFTSRLVPSIISIYEDYPELKKEKNNLLKILSEEESKFNKTLEKGLSIFDKKILKKEKTISGKDAFLLFQSYGFPIEQTIEEIKEFRKGGFKLDEEKLKEEFQKELEKHQALSRTASAGKFKSGLADNSEQTTKLHTATHLLNEALRVVLGQEVKQRGSNITPERLRFDFNFSRKLTQEELKKIEEWINKKISQSLEVKKEEISYKKAISEGAQGEFGHKYPERVSVYTIIDSSDKRGWASKEICTGPHVKNTKEIGHFKILKEESSSAGVRRIKATVEK